MMFNKLLSVSVCVFMFCFSVIEFAYSHPNVPPGTPRATEYEGFEELRDDLLKDMGFRQTRLLSAQLVIKDLNASWKANKTAIKAGRSVTITNALSTLFTAIGAVATGGTSVVAQAAVTGSGFITAATAYASASKTDKATLKRSTFVKAFSVALEGYGLAMDLQRKDWDEYTNYYFKVLEMEVEHDGGLYTGLSSSKFTVESLYKSINGLSVTINPDGSRDFETWRDGAPQKKKGYWHVIQGYRQNYLGNTDHVMRTHSRWEAVTIPELPATILCYGKCKTKYTNYYDAMYTNLVRCGTGEFVFDAAVKIASQMGTQIKKRLEPGDPGYDASLKTTYPTAYKALEKSKGDGQHLVWRSIERVLRQRRTFAEGCGISYYKCDTKVHALHSARKCIAVGAGDDGADAGDADGDGQASAPDDSNTPASASTSPSLVSSDGVYTAEAGGSHTATVSVPSGWTQIYWYLKSPSETGYGTSQSVVSDSTGSSTSASYTYSFPSGVSGDYVLTAYVYTSSGTIVEPSYTVSVSLPSSTDTTTTSSETTTSTSTPSSSVTVTISPGSGYTSTAQVGGSYTLTASVSEQIYGIKWYWKSPGSTEMLYTSNTFYSSVTTSDDLYLSFDGPNPTEYVGTHEFRVEVTLTNYDTHEASYTLTVVSNP